MRKSGNHIERVSPTCAIHTCMFKGPKSYVETLQKMDAFFKELGLLKAD